MKRIFLAVALLALVAPALAQNQSQRGLASDAAPAMADADYDAAILKLRAAQMDALWKKNGIQAHCWACMHGCTAEQDLKLCGWKN